MARPLKKPSERRRHVVNLRMTDAEFDEFKRLARDAGVTAGRYIRETVLGRRPKARPQQLLVFQELVRQLQYIATNFRQLATATGDDRYAPWARYMGADFVGHILDKDDLSDVVEPQLDALNTAGQQSIPWHGKPTAKSPSKRQSAALPLPPSNAPWNPSGRHYKIRTRNLSWTIRPRPKPCASRCIPASPKGFAALPTTSQGRRNN